MLQTVMGTRRAVERMTGGDEQAKVNLLVDGAAAGDRATVAAMLTYGADPMGGEGESGMEAETKRLVSERFRSRQPPYPRTPRHTSQTSCRKRRRTSRVFLKA